MSNERERPADTDLYMRYLGCLGLLAESSVYLKRSPEAEDIHESIQEAMEDACANYPLKWHQVLDRIEIESDPES